jgi:hypothetical protein
VLSGVCLIVVPSMGYDKPEFLRYQNPSTCLTIADVEHLARSSKLV